VSYPNKKPAVQIKKPKKYARIAPSLVPFNLGMIVCDELDPVSARAGMGLPGTTTKYIQEEYKRNFLERYTSGRLSYKKDRYARQRVGEGARLQHAKHGDEHAMN
jgi:hypothetical protein